LEEFWPTPRRKGASRFLGDFLFEEGN